MKRFRVALIGCGRISSRHIQAIQANDSMELVAVCDVSKERAERVASSTSSICLLDFKDITTKMQVDLVVVATDSGSHFEIASYFAGKGPAVLVEKPLTMSLESASQLVESFERAGQRLFVVKQNRLNPPVQRLLTALEQKEFGKLSLISINVLWCRTADYYNQDTWRLKRSSDGGVVWNQASHYADLLQLLDGGVSEVHSMGQNYFSPAETEDTIVAIGLTGNATLFNFVATTTARPANFEGSITVLGDSGLAKIGGTALNKFEEWTLASSIDYVPNAPSNPLDVYGLGHNGVYGEILQDLRGTKDSQFRAEAGLPTIELLELLSKKDND